jgi:lipopolysaccharide transport system permease protein
MSSGQQNTSAARLPLGSADTWIIAPELHVGFGARLREVWRYRRILLFFAFKAVQTLYANTYLGMWWLLIRPLAPVVVGTLVFGELMQAPSAEIPYFLFFLTGSIIWSFFSEPLIRGSRGLDVNRQLITKLYLPRVILPAGQLAAGLVEPLVLTGVFAVAVWYYRIDAGVWYGVDPRRVPVAIGAVLIAVMFAFAASLWTSVWQARARDIRYVLGYTLSFWFFLTPVVYPLSAVPPGLRWVAIVNPMTGPVEAFRWSLLGIGSPAWTALGVSCAATAVVLSLGLWYFATSESATVDKL